jgi:hypothetical protein
MLANRTAIKSEEYPHIVTPMFKVKLDDVLNRKHLPPLGSYLRSSRLIAFLMPLRTQGL